MTTAAHHAIPSASELQSLKECPGRFHARKGIESVENPDQRFGDNVHNALARYHAQIAQHGSASDDPPPELTHPEQETFAKCVALEIQLLRQHGFDNARIANIEERLAYQNLAGKTLFTAKPDVIWMKLGALLVVDFKSGWVGAANATENLQLRAQALCAWRHYLASNITVAIVSPNAPEAVTVAAYRADTLLASERQIAEIVAAATAQDAPRVPGQHQCRYCPAKLTCPEYQSWALLPAQQQLNAIASESKTISRQDVTKAVSSLPIQKLADIWLTKKPLGWLFTDIEERLRSLNKELLDTIGLEITPGKTVSSVSDIPTVFQRVHERHAVTPDEFLAVCDVGKGALEKLIKSKSKLKGAALAEEMARLLAGCVTETKQRGSVEPIKK